MLISYVRDDHYKPIGVIIATGRDKIGYSLCNKKDKWNRETGKRIAFGRAEKGSTIWIPNSVKHDYDKMMIRAKKYFKGE